MLRPRYPLHLHVALATSGFHTTAKVLFHEFDKARQLLWLTIADGAEKAVQV